MKPHPVGAAFFHDVRTDMTKLLVALRNFANAPENSRPQSRAQNTLGFGRIDPTQVLSL